MRDDDASPPNAESSPSPRPRVAVAGASGFVGRALLPRLAERGEVVALTRVPPAGSSGAIRWMRCDLFSIRETEAALEGVEFAFYLVHSMMPSARLTQASFADLDLLLADNFVRAAAAAGVRQIVYLGGIVPEGRGASRHLESRREVERALASRGVPLTALRAGLVMGAEGSSFQMLLRLVRRLPFMVCPRWTQNRTQPIALEDAVSLLLYVLGDPESLGKTYEIGGPDVMSYRDMIVRTAQGLGLRRRTFPVPLLSTRLSRLWVSAFTGTPRALVTPLIESLEHPMVASERRLQERAGIAGLSFDEAMRRAIVAEATSPPGSVDAPRAALRGERSRLRAASTVRSVQRLPLPAGRDASFVAREYVAWLPRFVGPLLAVDDDGKGGVRLGVRPLGVDLLSLRRVSERSGPDRELFRIEGGALVAASNESHARLEFREVLDGSAVLAAIHDYRPRLPWWLYNATQAQAHLAVMRGFARHLSRLDAGQAAPSNSP
ncbi:hypothetical protein MYXO_00171 [Myxococcaceae bacterium]|jgi:uncharacterized protein YbjT (DUF2867 family)|nr:hypothetical protein MYXO_00171 [Myxococcaceae bacterium]